MVGVQLVLGCDLARLPLVTAMLGLGTYGENDEFPMPYTRPSRRKTFSPVRRLYSHVPALVEAGVKR